MPTGISADVKPLNIKIMEHRHDEHCGLHLGFAIAKMVLKAATVAAAFCLVKEVHKVHKAIEHRER